MNSILLYSFISLLLISQIHSEVKELRIDMREFSKDKKAVEMMARDAQLCQKLNLALPYTEEYFSTMNELIYNQIGKNSVVSNQLTVVLPKNVTIGSGVTVMNGALMMAAGGITIEDKVMIAANVQLISNNHDPYVRDVITCRPILIKYGAWVGAGATILPGVTVGKYAIVGANSVVNKDIPDYAVAVGSPAKVIKYLDKEKFED